MSKRNGPPGYLSKQQAAARLGISTKTIDRRMRIGDLHARILRVGRTIWLSESDIERHFTVCVQRGHL